MTATSLGPYLDAVAERYRVGYLDSDPVGIVHGLCGREEIEVGGLLASVLSLGRVATIRAKTVELFDRLDGAPAAFIVRSPLSRMRKALSGFRHRFFGEEDLLGLMLNVRRLLEKHGSLEKAWKSDLPLPEALSQFSDELRGRTATLQHTRGVTLPICNIANWQSDPIHNVAKLLSGPISLARIPLVPAPRNGSTCKRALMYLRWMSRPADGVDFGLWNSLSPADLVIPMDTHIFKVSGLLGLTSARTPSWKAAVEVTSALRRISPSDPVRYDFALSRIGIVQGCKGRYVKKICGACPIFDVCAMAKMK